MTMEMVLIEPMYTVQFEEVVYVLHVFQKKSKSGIKTPKQEMDLVNKRLKKAHELYQERLRVKEQG